MRAEQLASSRFYEVGAGCYDLSEKRASLLPKSISGTPGIRSVPCCEHPTLLTEACSRTFEKIVSRLVREIASEPGQSRVTLFPVDTSTRFAFSDSFERGVPEVRVAPVQHL